MVNSSAQPGKGRNFRLTPLELLIILLAILGVIFLAASWNSGIENPERVSNPALADAGQVALTADNSQQLNALRQELEQLRRNASQTEDRVLARLDGLEQRLDSLSLPKTAPPLTSASEAGVKSEYVVRPGDSLGLIAEKFNIPLVNLRRWNNIGPQGDIRAGQRLRLSGS